MRLVMKLFVLLTVARSVLFALPARARNGAKLIMASMGDSPDTDEVITRQRRTAKATTLKARREHPSDVAPTS